MTSRSSSSDSADGWGISSIFIFSLIKHLAPPGGEVPFLCGEECGCAGLGVAAQTVAQLLITVVIDVTTVAQCAEAIPRVDSHGLTPHTFQCDNLPVSERGTKLINHGTD